MTDILSGAEWYLEGSVDGVASATRFGLKSFPVRIGRRQDLEVVLPVSHVSGLHAEIFEREGELWVRDAGSSNGTRLNQVLVAESAPLGDGDILHFADLEFVLQQASEAVPPEMKTCVLPAASDLLVHGARSQAAALRQMIDRSQVQAVFQPIVRLDGSAPCAYELLGRGARGGLPESPGPLFRIAESSGLACDLSALFRRVGVEAAGGLAGAPRIFVNVHPEEMGGAQLMRSLEELREQYPALPVALEVHEATVTDPHGMRELRAALVALDIQLAFDDFGAGQARLLELAESPPDYLKFDMSLIRGIHDAPASRQSMVENLVGMVRGIGVNCLAEGVECREELQTCVQMGFEFAQGYLLGRPQPVAAWREPPGEPRQASRQDAAPATGGPTAAADGDREAAAGHGF